MALDPISAVLSIGESLITRLFPDPAQQAEQRLKLTQMAQDGKLAELNAEVQLMLGQIETNKIQAQHKSLFVAGARPAVIWVCCASLCFTGVIHPLLVWLWAFNGIGGTPPPPLDLGYMAPILTGLLGLGGMRSFDKTRGTQTDSIRNSK